MLGNHSTITQDDVHFIREDDNDEYNGTPDEYGKKDGADSCHQSLSSPL
jgi:hypothetical protein